MVSTEGQPNISEDGTVAAGFIGLSEGSTGFDTQAIDDGRDLREDLKSLVEGSGLTVQSTGPVPQSLDSQDSSEDTLRIVAAATIILIVLLLALIFRSVIICLMPIVVVGLVSTIATGLIGWANDAFDLKADASIEQILVVVLYGVGTDYILFFLFRYRERLRQGEDKRASVVHALERAGEAIASAGGAVIVAFLALILQLVEHLPSHRARAGHRRCRDAARGAHAGARDRDAVGQSALLALQEVEAGARGCPVRTRW